MAEETICNQCGKEFESSDRLNSHLRDKHQVIKESGNIRISKRKLIWSFVGIAVIAVLIWVFTAGSPSSVAGSTIGVSAEDPFLGEADAPVTIVEYGDYQCPLCNRFFREAEPQIIENYIETGKVKLVWKDFQFIGPDSQRAAEAARCAKDQNKFWEYHDALYNYIWDNYYVRGINGENVGAYSKSNLKELSNQIGLDTEQFNSCFDSGTYTQLVRNSLNEGESQGVQGTPTFFINGQKIVGAQPYSVFSQIIESELP